jgi:hypothetical protein
MPTTNRQATRKRAMSSPVSEPYSPLNTYRPWVDMAVRGMRSILKKEPGTCSPSRPFGSRYQSLRGRIPGSSEGRTDGSVRVHRENDPGLFKVSLTGKLIWDGDTWDSNAALMVFQMSLPGTISEPDLTTNGLHFTYDMRLREEKIPDLLGLHWACEISQVVTWFKQVPQAIRLSGSELTEWETCFTDARGTITSNLEVRWRWPRRDFKVECTTTDGTTWDKNGVEKAFEEIFRQYELRFDDTPGAFKVFICTR